MLGYKTRIFLSMKQLLRRHWKVFAYFKIGLQVNPGKLKTLLWGHYRGLMGGVAGGRCRKQDPRIKTNIFRCLNDSIAEFANPLFLELSHFLKHMSSISGYEFRQTESFRNLIRLWSKFFQIADSLLPMGLNESRLAWSPAASERFLGSAWLVRFT